MWSGWYRMQGWSSLLKWAQQMLSLSKVSKKWLRPAKYHLYCPVCQWWSSRDSRVCRRKYIKTPKGKLLTIRHYSHISGNQLCLQMGREKQALPCKCGPK
jgi:hypothetical protein